MLKPTSEVVILVDSQDRVVGTEEKHKAHMTPPQRHRAFSVFAFNEAGETLIQRRAFGKYHSAGLWANTCCGHPRPSEDIQEAAKRRTFEELGFTPGALTPLTQVSYTLHLGQDLWELEYTHVFRCEYDSSSRALFQEGVAIQENSFQTGLPRRAAALLAMTSSHSSDTECVNADSERVRADTERNRNTSSHGLNINREEVCDTLWILPAELLTDVKVNPQNYARWFRLYVLKYFDVIFGGEGLQRMAAHG